MFLYPHAENLSWQGFQNNNSETLVCQQFQRNAIIYIHALDFLTKAEALLRADLSDFLHISKQVKKFCWKAKASIFVPLKKFSL